VHGAGAGAGGLERREKQAGSREKKRTGSKWWVVGSGVANHHMSAHGVPGPPLRPVDGSMGCPPSLPTRNAMPRRKINATTMCSNTYVPPVPLPVEPHSTATCPSLLTAPARFTCRRYRHLVSYLVSSFHFPFALPSFELSLRSPRAAHFFLTLPSGCLLPLRFF
jgi:hypothetical protein